MTDTTKLTCPICKGDDFKQPQLSREQLAAASKDWQPEHPYLECVECGLWVQPNPPPKRFESSAEEGQRKEIVLREHQSHARFVWNHVEMFGVPGSVLEIGCSYPIILSLFKSMGSFTVLGIDGSSSAEKWGEELGVPVMKSDFLARDKAGLSNYDLTIMMHVIEHFTDPQEAFERLVSFTRPEKHIFLRTPLNDTVGIATYHMMDYHYEVHPVVFGTKALRIMERNAKVKMVRWHVADEIGHGDFWFQRS